MTPRRKFLFVGVTTSSSAVVDLFPRWADAIGVEWELQGVDIPVGADVDAYRELRELLSQDDVVGGLVTTHKAALFRAESHSFDLAEPLCFELGEIGIVFKRDGSVCAGVSDVVSGGVILEEVTSRARWLEGARSAVVLGAGGAGLAVTWNLSVLKVGKPGRVLLVERDPKRRQEVAALVQRWPTTVTVELGDDGDAAVADAGEAPLVINATGMGKDRPGSPLAQPFPHGSTVWEFNYRGDLKFLVDATSQGAADDIECFDGSRYFAAGWSVVMSRVANSMWTRARFENFLQIAGMAG